MTVTIDYTEFLKFGEDFSNPKQSKQTVSKRMLGAREVEVIHSLFYTSYETSIGIRIKSEGINAELGHVVFHNGNIPLICNNYLHMFVIGLNAFINNYEWLKEDHAKPLIMFERHVDSLSHYEEHTRFGTHDSVPSSYLAVDPDLPVRYRKIATRRQTYSNEPLKVINEPIDLTYPYVIPGNYISCDFDITHLKVGMLLDTVTVKGCHTTYKVLDVDTKDINGPRAILVDVTKTPRVSNLKYLVPSSRMESIYDALFTCNRRSLAGWKSRELSLIKQR